MDSRAAKDLTDNELIERLAEAADEAAYRLRFHAKYGNGARAVRLAEELEPIFNNGLVDVNRWGRLAEGQSKWRQEAEERLISALEKGTDEALLAFLEWYYGPWHTWPVHELLTWYIRPQPLDSLERTIKPLYVKGLRRAAAVDWTTLDVFVHDERSVSLRNDLRAEAIAAWGQRVNWLMERVPLEAACVASLGDDAPHDLPTIVVRKTPQGYEPFIDWHTVVALLITPTEETSNE